MYKLEKFLVTPLLVLFFSHGLLYYIFPEQHYTSSGGSGGWISYLKYINLLIAAPLLVKYQFNKQTASWFSIGVILLILPLVPQLYWLNEGNLLLAQYQISVSAYFFAPYLIRLFKHEWLVHRTLLSTLAISFVAVVYEIITGGLIGEYSRSGFRSAGPFINPNNTGIVIAIFAVLHHHKIKGITLNLLAAFFAISVIAITGSKTAAAIYAVGAFFTIPTLWRMTLAALTPMLLALFSSSIIETITVLELRDLSTESGFIRSDSISRLIEQLFSTPIPSLLLGFTKESMVDNSYFDLISYGGVLITLIFIAIQVASVAICIKHRLRLALLIHAMLFLAMLTTNIVRLWPTAYMYWALISITFFSAIGPKSSRTPTFRQPIPLNS